MTKTIITISREFGSGGVYIGKELAKRLGFEFYDRDIIDRVAEKTLIAENVVKNYSEELQEDKMVKGHYFGDTLLNDSIIAAQKQVIEEFAQQGNCVIVGRCANIYLQDRPEVLNVFIESDRLARLTRICQLHDVMGVEAETLMNKYDKKRHLYYQYCTNRSWGDRMDYDVVLKSNKIGLDACVDVLERMCK